MKYERISAASFHAWKTRLIDVADTRLVTRMDLLPSNEVLPGLNILSRNAFYV